MGLRDVRAGGEGAGRRIPGGPDAGASEVEVVGQILVGLEVGDGLGSAGSTNGVWSRSPVRRSMSTLSWKRLGPTWAFVPVPDPVPSSGPWPVPVPTPVPVPGFGSGGTSLSSCFRVTFGRTAKRGSDSVSAGSATGSESPATISSVWLLALAYRKCFGDRVSLPSFSCHRTMSSEGRPGFPEVWTGEWWLPVPRPVEPPRRGGTLSARLP